MAPTLGSLYFLEQTSYKAQKALIAAKFIGANLDKKVVDPAKDIQKPEFVAKNPTGKVPFLETDQGVIFTSNAVARYVARCRADTSLYGKCFDDEGDIDTWLEFCTQDIEVPLMTWVYPVLGLMEDNAKATSEAQADVKKALGVLEFILKERAFLVGDFVTLADIVLVCALKEGFVRVFDGAFRKPFPNATAWFEKCCALPQFKSILGDVKLCSAVEKPKPVQAAFAPAARAAEQPKAKEAPKAKAEPKAAAAKAKSEPKAAPKAKAEPKAAAAPAPAAGGAVDEAAVKAKGDEIRVLKEKLKADGLSGKKINEHPEVKSLVDQLSALKTGAAAAPAAKPAAAPAAGGDLDAQIKSKGDEIRVLKEKLKADGLSGKKINEHSDVKSLVEQLTALKSKA